METAAWLQQRAIRETESRRFIDSGEPMTAKRILHYEASALSFVNGAIIENTYFVIHSMGSPGSIVPGPTPVPITVPSGPYISPSPVSGLVGWSI